MARENPTWGEGRIADELLLKLGLRVSPRTIRKYLPKWPAAPAHGPRGDQRWAVLLKNHAQFIVACDFCVVVTATFRILYVLVVMEHASRRVIHLNATAHPTAAWTLQQLRETIPSDHGYRFIIHDHDAIFSGNLDTSLTRLGLKVVTAEAQSAGELTLRKTDRDSPAGVPRLDYSAERRAPEKHPGVVDGPLQTRQATYRLGTRHSRTEVGRSASRTLRASPSTRSSSRGQTDLGRTPSRIRIAKAGGMTLPRNDAGDNIAWQGVLLSVTGTKTGTKRSGEIRE